MRCAHNFYGLMKAVSGLLQEEHVLAVFAGLTPAGIAGLFAKAAMSHTEPGSVAMTRSTWPDVMSRALSWSLRWAVGRPGLMRQILC
jgi:hypothetical protein